jgi:G6PDH family F420-dependent oxidoreductase
MTKILYYCGHEQFQPEELVKHAVLAEKYGFDGILISEHFHPWVADKGSAGFTFSTLGAIAVSTKTIELITGVVTPLFRYHPAIIAQASATIDRLSKGRFTLGVGNGESINETPLGINFPPYKERSERMIEALEIMKRLFSGEKLTYEGKYYKLKNAKLYSPPVSDISILLAASGEKSISIANQYADGLITSVKDINEIKYKIENTKKLNKIVLSTMWTIYAKNQIEAWDALLPWRGLRVPSRDIATDPEELQKEADLMNKDDIISKYKIVSSPQEYIDAYSPLITELHSDYIGIQTTGKNQENIIKMLGEEVLPYLRSL